MWLTLLDELKQIVECETGRRLQRQGSAVAANVRDQAFILGSVAVILEVVEEVVHCGHVVGALQTNVSLAAFGSGR